MDKTNKVQREIDGKLVDVYLEYFVYGTGWINLAAVAGSTATAIMNISSDADFECNYIQAVVKQAGVLITTFGGTVQIDDSGRGRKFFNQQIPIDSIAGRGGLPYPLSPPRWFRRNSSITLSLTNSPTGIETDVFLSFHGNKMYFREAQGKR
jgi:hypothetical protein